MFRDWINRKYREWRGDKIGREGGVSAYARYINVSQQVMDGWLRGTVPQDETNILLLYDKYGDEVYEILGRTITEKDEVVYLYGKADREMQREILKFIRATVGGGYKRANQHTADKNDDEG